jgi:hypothetical protein
MSRLFNALTTADAILVSTSADPILVFAGPFISARGSGARVPPPHRSTAPLLAALAARCLAHLPIADHICCAALLVAGRPLLRLEILMERAD